MSGQEWAALAITGAALSWLVWRGRKRGLDEEGAHAGHGCDRCAKDAAPRADGARASRPTTRAARPEREPPAHP